MGNASLMCSSPLVCDWSVLTYNPVVWLLQRSAGSNTRWCRWPLPCTCRVKSSCGSRVVLASLTHPSKEAYWWEQKHIQGILSFGPHSLLYATDWLCCAYRMTYSHTAWLCSLLLFLVWILNFPLSIIHAKKDFREWMLHVHVERICIHVHQVKSRKRRNQNS